jgi:hypothetical protein
MPSPPRIQSVTAELILRVLEQTPIDADQFAE